MKELIAIQSVSQNEKDAAVYLAPVLEKIGFSVQVKTLEGCSTNVIGIKEGRSSRKLLLGGHIDVVAPGEGWHSDPYRLTEKNGRLYGRGVLDMKGGLACQIAVLETLYAEGALEDMNIELVGLCDEERYSIGAADYCAELLTSDRKKPDFGIFAEPHFDEIVIGATGKALLKLTVTGKTGHAAHPESGINAVENMASFLTALGSKYMRLYETGRSGSMAVLQVENPYEGYSLNIPDQCSCLLSKQLLPKESAAQFEEDLQIVFAESAKGQLRIERQIPSYSSYVLDKNDADIILLKTIAEKARGLKIRCAVNQSVSDANVMWEKLGMPVVLYGLNGKRLHEADEYVEIASAVQYMADMRAFVIAFFEENGYGCL